MKAKELLERLGGPLDLDKIEAFADHWFGKVGIDVEFTRHFIERLHTRDEAITARELAMLFKKEAQRWGKPIAQMDPNSEAVLKDMSSDVNVPFVLKWDRVHREFDLVAKTVMQKPDFKTPDREFTVENYDTSQARIAHIEDLTLSGSAGVKRAITILEQALSDNSSISFKPDGKPAVKWGRVNGVFVFGDRYMDPLPTSPKELAQMLNSRRGGGREDLIEMYAKLWKVFESSVSSNFSGIVFGDLMYRGTPPQKNGKFVFKPNTVTYSVDTNSEIGQRVAGSIAGVVVHTFLPENSKTGKHVSDVKNIPGLQIDGALAIISDSMEINNLQPPSQLKKVKSAVGSQGRDLDQLLDPTTLTELKIKALPGLVQKYINARVRERSYNDLQNGFFKWLATNSTKPMNDKIQQYKADNPAGFDALFGLFLGLAEAKAAVVSQLDQMSSGLEADVGGAQGHEGYLIHTSNGPVKLIDRFKFSAANFEK